MLNSQNRPSVNQRGQGLVEYLILVALMGVATIAVVRVMGQAVQSRFATITHALQGEKKTKKVQVEESNYKKRDLSDFMDGVSQKGSSGTSGASGAE